MISQRNLTIALVLVVGILFYQTAALAQITKKLSQTDVGIGASPTTVSFTDDGSAPSMVGGC